MAGGFFSGGSNDAVSGSVAEAEAAAREAEEARDAILDVAEIYGENDTNDEEKLYTVPLSGTNSPAATSFLNQQGDWTVPGNTDPDPYVGVGAINVNGLNISINDGGLTTVKLADDIITTDKITNLNVTGEKIATGAVDTTQLATGAVDRATLDITNTGTDGQVLSRAGDRFTWITESTDGAITAGEGINITDTTISLADDGVTTAKIVDGDVTRAKLDITNTGTDGQVLSLDGTRFTWIDDSSDDTTYTAGTGLDLTNDQFSLDAVFTDLNDITAPGASQFLQRNADDDAYIWVDGVASTVANLTDVGDIPDTIASTVLARNAADDGYEWITDNNSDTTYTGSDGITLTGTNFTLTDGGIDEVKLNITNPGSDGQVLSKADTGFTWIDNADITYTAGTGLDLTGTEFSIADGGVDTAQLADNTITEVKITDSSVTRDKIANNAINADKLGVVGDGDSGQILTSAGNGSFTWEDPDGNTAYTAGEGLDLTGAEFSLSDDGVTTAKILDNNVTTAKIPDSAINSAKIADNNVTADELNVSGDGTSGQYLTSDGDGSFSWITGGGGTLAALSDTNIPASISDRRLLEFEPSDGTWNATSISDILRISDMFDVHEDTPTDGQFLRYDADNSDGPGWVNTTVTIPGAVAAGTGISVSGSTVSVTPNGITNALLANNSVRTENITDGTITGTDMADGTVGNTQIADDAVTAAKIADNTITATQVAANTLTASQLATDSVTSFKIQDGAVIAGKIANNVVGADELNVEGDGSSGQFLTSDGDGSFSWTTSSGGVTYTAGTGLDLSDTNVFSVPNDGITSALIATNAVGTDQIANDAVTGTQLAAGSVGTTELEDTSVTLSKMASNSVDTAQLLAGSVTTAKIATGAVMSASLGSDAVTSIKIIDAAVTSGKLATDIPISTFSDVNTTGVNNGQILTYNGTTWVPTNNSGGGNTDNSRLGITLSPTSLNEGDEATSISVALAIVNMISDETISGQSVTVTDPTGHSVAVSGSGNSFTFMASTANNGNFVVRASATFTTGGTSTVHSSSANLPVIPTPADNINWYQWVTDTEPTAITSTGVVDNGVYNSPETGDWTRPDADTDLSTMAYVALPTGTYTFHAGLLFATITNLGVISTDYTLYRLDDFEQVAVGGTRIITITEA